MIEQDRNLYLMSKLSRQDFQLIAETIRDLPDTASRDVVAQRFADALKATNPRFDFDRFVKVSLSERQR